MGDRLPYISVVMTTHNRTNVACAVIDSLVKNLKYPRINWIISDDRSDNGHVEQLVEQFKKNNISDVKVCKTDNNRYGLGASLNNGLMEAFKVSPIVLTTEDDWILEKELKLAYFVDLINRNEDIAAIRLATLNYAESRPSEYNLLSEVYSFNNIKNSVFNNQVALRHKRVYDKIGYYRENVNSDISEQDIIKKFNSQNQLKVYFPDFIKKDTMDDPSMFFIHVGKSTIDHKQYTVPERFKWIYYNQNYNDKFDVIVSLTSFPNRFRNYNLIQKCLDSLINQNTKYNFHIVFNIFKNDIQFIPNELLEYCKNNNVEILSCDEDIKGHKKYFYVMQKYKDIPIILVDDDLIFYDNLVESLFNKYIEDKNVIWSGWCQKLNLSNKGRWIYSPILVNNSNDETPSFEYKFGSGSGTLIPPMKNIVFENLLKLIKYGDNIFHDELVIKKLSLMNHLKVGLCKNKKYTGNRQGWLTHTQFIKDEIQSQVESYGNLHTINCQHVNINGNIMYRGTKTEMDLFNDYIIFKDTVIKL